MARHSWIDEIPTMRMTAREFRSLLDYSGSLPTGTIPGKRWKRLDGAHDPAFIMLGGTPRWVIGEYGKVSADGKTIELHWYRPIVSVAAGKVPKS